MRILILGGTNFIGPHFIEAALAAGHEITLFNRGKTSPEAFADLEQLRGDRREGDYKALAGRTWDVVLDTCAYWPRAVDEALAALGDRFEHYVLVSTVSVFADFDDTGFDEDAPLATTDEPDAEEVTPKNYGALKVLCETAAAKFGGAVTIVRPGLVVGPGDATDRFTYWPVTVDRGGRVLAPGTPDDPAQWIDARDLGRFMLRLMENRTEGIFNVVTPRRAHTFGELLKQCVSASSAEVELVWVDSGFLHENEVRAWNDLPAWVPPASPLAGIAHCISTRAVDAGLTFTPLERTVRDTLAWFNAERGDELRAGLKADAAAELLTLWDARDV